ncbi:MAG: hypothetical protein ABIY55_27790, partial [Kofleriaceae bacterium]
MKQRLAGFLLAAAVVGCGPKHASFVKVDDVKLGRVVIYRNGVAFYERHAIVDGGILTVSVPRERVDDFLKSLTVVDAISKRPLPVSIPRQQTDDGTNLVMNLQLPSKDTAEVVLTYVTESPAWKPSYRVVVGEHDVMLEGWAIVDNTSGEDWKNVLVGVGSSSALSFRYDLWSVRQVQRETLANEEKFAVAPPTGMSPYGGAEAGKPAGGEVLLSELTDDEIRRPAGHPEAAATEPNLTDEELRTLAEQEAKGEVITVTGSTIERKTLSSPAPMSVVDKEQLQSGPRRSTLPAVHASKSHSSADARVAVGDLKMKQLSQQIVHSNQTIVVEGYAQAAGGDADRR